MFNPEQFKKKKKREINPDIPRPNLFSHEKKLKETTASMSAMANRILQQEKQINKMQSQINDIKHSIDMILGVLRRRQ